MEKVFRFIIRKFHITFGKVVVHWKPDKRHPFVQQKNCLICDLFLYAIQTVDKLHDLVLGQNRLILISGFQCMLKLSQ